MSDESKTFPARVDWDFDAVLDAELHACLLWEYARESWKIAQYAWYSDLQEKAKEEIYDYRTKAWIDNSSAEQALAARTLQEEFASYEPELLDALHDTETTNIGFNELMFLLLHAPDANFIPWQELTVDCRARMAAKHAEQNFFPSKAALLYDLENLWEENSEVLREIRSTPRPPEDDSELCELHSTSAQPSLSQEEDCKMDFDLTMAFTFDFRRFTDKEILASLGEWLRANRPCPEPVRRGRKLNDLRVALDDLGILRLFNQFPLSDPAFPLERKRRGKSACHRAHRRAIKTFHELFPFLDGEKMQSESKKRRVSKKRT